MNIHTIPTSQDILYTPVNRRPWHCEMFGLQLLVGDISLLLWIAYYLNECFTLSLPPERIICAIISANIVLFLGNTLVKSTLHVDSTTPEKNKGWAIQWCTAGREYQVLVLQPTLKFEPVRENPWEGKWISMPTDKIQKCKRRINKCIQFFSRNNSS